tara:strand:- start:390 stop:2147 length:1758 start_codon:yes stop_codon:yes gene_type:complete
MAENESGFDTLKTFSQPEGTFSFDPYQGYEQAGQALRKEAKEAINTDLAVTAVDETPNYNKLANQFAGQYIPVRQASEDEAGIIAQQLGLGKRYSAEEMKAQIEKTLGPLPERNQKRRAVSFLVNSLRAKTPYKGAAGVLDVLLQSYSVDMTQEQALEIEQLKHKMAVGELAVKQAQDANEAVLAKEAQFYLKKMGQDNDYLQKYLSFNSDLSKKFAQFDIDKELNKIKGAQELINNPGRLDPNISYTVNGQTFTNVSRRVLNEDGEYQYKLIDEDGNFTRPVPINPETGFPDFFISPKQAPITEASLRDTGGTGISGSKQAELSGDIFALDRASQTLGDILNSQAEAIKKGGSYLGITGVINNLYQEAPLLFDDILDGITGGSKTWGEPADNSVYNMIDFEVPKDGFTVFGKTKTVTKNVNLAALLDTMTYTSLGYDKTYAQNKVRENIIIYALARAQKPTGRLNVDDVKRASDSVNISGLQSDERVQAQLEEVLKFINRGIQSIYDQGYQQNTKGENYNIFDSNQAIDGVIKRMQENLGISESEITKTEEPVEGEVPNTTVSDEDEEEAISISNDQIFSGGNI